MYVLWGPYQYPIRALSTSHEGPIHIHEGPIHTRVLSTSMRALSTSHYGPIHITWGLYPHHMRAPSTSHKGLIHITWELDSLSQGHPISTPLPMMVIYIMGYLSTSHGSPICTPWGHSPPHMRVLSAWHPHCAKNVERDHAPPATAFDSAFNAAHIEGTSCRLISIMGL